jgi:arylsulfatase A-like enzyme
MTEKAIEWLDRHGDAPWLMHISYIRPHPPRRNPVGYHDLYSADQVGPFSGFGRPETEAAFHPLNHLLVNLPLSAAPHDEGERRQLRATYYGAQAEVDNQLGRLFAYLDDQGLAATTLVVLTSDHGEMGGDHWLVEKCGYWDESFHVPLIVRDPLATGEATRGLVVQEPTESVDVAATILDWMGAEIPVQVDGWPLTPFIASGTAPEHWRAVAHWEWDFRHVQYRYAEKLFGIPGEHCSLAVGRRAGSKYVQFAASPDVLPPLLFDLVDDPGHTVNLAAGTGTGNDHLALQLDLAQEMLRWRMRNMERTLTNCYLAPGPGPIWGRDTWR